MNQKVIRILLPLLMAIALVSAFFLVPDRPGTNLMITGSCLVFLLFALPLVILSGSGKDPLGRNVFVGVAALVSILSIGTGFIFKFQHWPGSDYLIGFGSLLLSLSLVSALAFFFRSKSTRRGKAVSPILLLLPFLIIFLFVYGGLAGVTELPSQKPVQAAATPDFKALKNSTLKKSGKESEEALKVHAATLKMVDFIQAYKDFLIMETEGIRPDMLDEFYARQMYTHGENFETPTRILIGDPTSPETGSYSAHLLKKGIEQYRDFLCELADDHACEEVSKILDPENKKARKKYNDSWEMHNFYELPLAAVVEKLSNLQMTILSCEAVAITGIKSVDIASEE